MHDVNFDREFVNLWKEVEGVPREQGAAAA
jgi:hypothetical protein